MTAASASTTDCRALEVSRSRHKVETLPSGPCTITAATREGNALVMGGGVDRGRGYFPFRVANRIMGAPAISGARVAQAWACADSASDTARVALALALEEFTCIMGPILLDA